MTPSNRVLTVSDLNAIGVVAALVGFVGFTVGVWMLVWQGFDRTGRLKPALWGWALVSVVSYLLMLWGLTKA
jgi:predicted lysophospholipase L1 biosynthesis ABC-type transport system permease subunit